MCAFQSESLDGKFEKSPLHLLVTPRVWSWSTEDRYLYPWVLISHIHFSSFSLNHSFKFLKPHRKIRSFCLSSFYYSAPSWLKFIFTVCGCEASHARSMLVMMNNSNGMWSWLLRLNLSDPPLVLGGVEFGMNGKEPYVLFGVLCRILGPCQNLYIEGVRFVDGGVTWKS